MMGTETNFGFGLLDSQIPSYDDSDDNFLPLVDVDADDDLLSVTPGVPIIPPSTSDYDSQAPESQGSWRNISFNSPPFSYDDSSQGDLLRDAFVGAVGACMPPLSLSPITTIAEDCEYKCPVSPVENLFQQMSSVSQSGQSAQTSQQVETGGTDNSNVEVDNLCKTFSQSSTVSVDDAVPAMDPWKGSYDFRFSIPDEPMRKFQFSQVNNKMYCVNDQDTEILFVYDYDKCNAKEMSLVAFLRYKNSEAATEPIIRCSYHDSLERETLEQKGQATEKLNLVSHVLRCSHLKTKYFQDEATKRCYLKVPLGRPQPGVVSVSRLFRFTCLGSCKFPGNVKKNQMAVVFELRERDQVVGRVSFDVKVCTCPYRDFCNDEPDMMDASEVKSMGKRAKKSKLCRKPNQVKRLAQPRSLPAARPLVKPGRKKRARKPFVNEIVKSAIVVIQHGLVDDGSHLCLVAQNVTDMIRNTCKLVEERNKGITKAGVIPGLQHDIDRIEDVDEPSV